MKKLVIYILLAMTFVSCGNSYEEQKRISKAERVRLAREDSLALKIAVLPTIDCLPLYVAKDRQLYDTLSLDLRLRRFTSQMDCDTAVMGKSVDGVMSDLVRTEGMKRNGVPLDYMSATNLSWKLIANHKARLKRLDQMGDKMVAMTRFSATDFLTDYAFNGVKTSSIVFRIQVNDINVRLAMLLNNEMDAMWLPEPQATVALSHGNVKLFDSDDKDIHLGVMAFRSDMIKDSHRQKQLTAFIKAYNLACDSINKRGISHYSDIMYKYFKADAKTVKSLPKIKFNHIAKPRQTDLNIVKSKK